MYELPPGIQLTPGFLPGAGTADPTRGFDAAFSAYVSALQDAVGPPDVQERINDAHRAYVEVLQGALSPEPVQQQATEAYHRYCQALQEALAARDARERAAGAYAAYVRAVRDAWAGADADRVDVHSMARISQSMTTVAWTAAASTTEMAPPAAGTPGAP